MLHIDDEAIEINGETKHLMAELMALIQVIYEDVKEFMDEETADRWLNDIPNVVRNVSEVAPFRLGAIEDDEDDPYRKMLGEDDDDY